MRLGPFVLERPAAAGGVGEVWRGRYDPDDRGVGAPVAVKVLPARWSRRAAFRDAFAHEARAMASLSHPHVLAVLDHGLAAPLDGAPYLVMPWAEGSLADALPLGAWSDVRAALDAALAGLAHAHARGVIHRDLKPANVLRFGGRWVVADWGIAATADRVGLGAASGTPGYMAPEQRRGEAQGPEADLYALGAVAWELVCGAPEPRDWPMPAAVAVPDALAAWVARMLEPDPARRFRSAAAARAALPAVDAPLGDVRAHRPRPGAHDTGVTLAHLTGRVTGATLAADDDDAPLPVDAAAAPPLPAPAAPPAPARVPWPLPDAGLGLVAFRDPPWVGRAAERAALWAALRDTLAAGTVRHVRLVGPPGVGRSRLAAWIAEAAHEAGVARALHVAVRPDGDAWAAAVGLVDPPARAAALRARVSALAADFPRVIIVDPPTADLPLVDGDPGPALVVVVADAGDGIAAPPLSDADLADLLHGWLDLDPTVAGRLVARAAGRPKALVDAVRAGVDAGRFHRGPRGWVVDAEAAVELSDAHRPLAAIANRLGPTVPVATWARLADVAGARWDPSLPGRLVRLGLAWAPEPGVIVLAQPLADGPLSTEAWARIAAALAGDSPERIARARIAAGEVDAGAALLADAARAWRRRGVFGRAAVAVDEGLATGVTGPLRAALTLERVEQLRLTGRPDAAARALDEVRAMAGPGRGWAEVRARIAMNDAEMARIAGRLDEAHAHARRAVADAEAAGAPGIRSIALAALGNVERRLGQPSAVARFEDAYAAAHAADDVHLQAQAALLTALWHSDAGDVAATERWAARAEAVSAAHDLALLRPSALSLLGGAARHRGDWPGALAAYAASAEGYRRIGHVLTALADMEVALLAVALGDVERGREVWLRWRHHPAIAGDPRLRLASAAIGARLAVDAGDPTALQVALDGLGTDDAPLGAADELAALIDAVVADLGAAGEGASAARLAAHRARIGRAVRGA